MFQPQELRRLAPRLHPASAERNGQAPHGNNPSQRLDPLAATEEIAYEFLAKGGKHSRPFITLAAYRAFGQQPASDPHHSNGSSTTEVPDAVKRCALSIETFHKASLVHDDIEDDDEFRYGDPTLHRQFGIPTAINVGDYLIGLGYRLVIREAKALARKS